MTKLLLALLCWCVAVGGEVSAPRSPQAPAVTFAAYDVFVDSGNSLLGAWQIEWLVQAGSARIVGVEGGDGVFAPAPYYDPAALQGGRIVIAAFATDGALPHGKARVARVHLQLEGDGARFAAQLQACADGTGSDCEGNVSWTKVEAK